MSSLRCITVGWVVCHVNACLCECVYVYEYEYHHTSSYFDFLVYGGVNTGTERCLHHYGAPLNAVPLFDAYRRDPTHDEHLLRVAFGAVTGTLANIEACCWLGDPGLGWAVALGWVGGWVDHAREHWGVLLLAQRGARWRSVFCGLGCGRVGGSRPLRGGGGEQLGRVRVIG
jgi:hypothetical protein